MQVKKKVKVDKDIVINKPKTKTVAVNIVPVEETEEGGGPQGGGGSTDGEGSKKRPLDI